MAVIDASLSDIKVLNESIWLLAAVIPSLTAAIYASFAAIFAFFSDLIVSNRSISG
jgi:hypothetical protein